jgi:hypothetical protein
MSVTSEQIQAAEDLFFATVPAALAYRTDVNLDRMLAFIKGAFPEAEANPAAWEIAFKSLNTVGKLKRISGYVAPITDEQRRLVNITPSYIARDQYKTDAAFKEAFDLVAAEEEELKRNPWLRLSSSQYLAMDPNRAAQLYVDDPQFAAAVQNLIDRGEI